MVIAGFGCRAEATMESFRSALAQTGMRPDSLAVPADRTAVIAPFAGGMAVHAIAADLLQGIDTPTRSTVSMAARGVGSVAEAVALAAAGPGARIVVARVISSDRMATCAIAQGLEE
ncbi:MULTISPECIES: cobalamin biosynthesis protein [Sphingomonas]|jgi:cobalt-precorrin 5A hydrolase|uniref:Precorrin methylase n=1 Tax=Sphingomonas zeae TaxID=1646122 RepID=A0A7Y6B889_9SPHN|nr:MULTISPECIES: cobalamin biosynthesis protein [Sphingomonas]MBB4047153.1 cobalt-precorrin 5A hydrolase [Sphingomonas zeae]MDK8186384.1 cobalamin biosynthesis protein [Sphingomonas zeae]MDK8215995.1 cobalamin biosynthesis protein [Sphingomonas sp. UMB7805-LC452B]NUU48302.1 precorrin methylase [Sphingomonas zeae]